MHLRRCQRPIKVRSLLKMMKRAGPHAIRRIGRNFKRRIVGKTVDPTEQG